MNNWLPRIGFLVLTLALLTVGYMVCYCWWMTSHPVYQDQGWETRFYQRIGLFIPLLLAWFWGLKRLLMPNKRE